MALSPLSTMAVHESKPTIDSSTSKIGPPRPYRQRLIPSCIAAARIAEAYPDCIREAGKKLFLYALIMGLREKENNSRKDRFRAERIVFAPKGPVLRGKIGFVQLRHGDHGD